MSNDLIQSNGNLTIENPNAQPKRYPALIFVDGQYLIDMNDINGNHIQKFVDPRNVRQAFTHLPVDSGWLSPNVVRWGMNRHGEWVVTFIPPQIHRLPFIGEDKENPQKITELVVPLPGLVFFGNAGTYGVWAVKSAAFDPFAAIFKAPLPNVGATSEICFGVNKPPRANANTIGKAWDIFVNSPFNQETVQGKSKAHPNDVRVRLRELNQIGTTYPLDDLVPYFEQNVTVDTFFNGYIESVTDGGL